VPRSIRIGLVIAVFAVGAMAQVAPTVTTLPATGVGATSATLNAQFTVGDAQHLQNPGFEDALGPANWNSASLVRLDGETETGPITAAFDRVTGYGRLGYMGRLRYETSTLGWVGLACEQRLNVTVPEGAPVVLSYLIRIQHETRTSEVSDHGGLVEVEISAGGVAYRLRYYHRRKRALPPNAARLHHVNAGDPGWRTWTAYEWPLTSDVQAAFGLSAFTVTAVRLGILMNRQGLSPLIHWLWDDVELKRGGVVVWHEYRRAGEPTWTRTAAVAYAGDGSQAVPVTGLTPGATYRHRAALAYAGGVIHGQELEFGTLQVFTVQVNVHPPTSGIVGGGGAYTHGTTVTATATPNAGYRFVNWTEGGAEAWTTASYTFTVTADRDLVAHFVLPGDVNLDGVVDVRDVRIIHQAALGLVTLSLAQRVAADVNSDGTVTVADAETVATRIIGRP